MKKQITQEQFKKNLEAILRGEIPQKKTRKPRKKKEVTE